MHIIKFSILLGTLIYAYLLEKNLLNIIILLIIFYTIIEYLIRLKSENTLKTKVTFCNWDDTGNPSVFLNVEVDIDNCLNFLEKYNKENNKNLNLKHLTLKALGYGFNNDITYGKISLGNFISTESIDVSIFEKINKKIFYTTIRNCNNKNIKVLNQEFENIEKKNFYDDNIFFEKIKYLPDFISDITFKLLTHLSYDLNLSIPFLNYKKDHFGQILFYPSRKNNMTNFNLPLYANFKSFATVVMNNIKKEPILKDNGELSYKNVLKFCLTFDHRFGDGSSMIDVLPRFKEVFENPEKFL